MSALSALKDYTLLIFDWVHDHVNDGLILCYIIWLHKFEDDIGEVIEMKFVDILNDNLI